MSSWKQDRDAEEQSKNGFLNHEHKTEAENVRRPKL